MEAKPFEFAPWLNEMEKMEEDDNNADKDNVSEDIGTKFKATSDIESGDEKMSESKKKEKANKNDHFDKEFENDEWLKSRWNRLLMTTFHDGNIKYHNGEELKEKSETDMRDSMLYTLYLNMSVCYMKLKHFELAEDILQECSMLQSDNSQMLYRTAMAISCNLDSSLEKLKKAQGMVLKAIELKDTEKIFQHNKNMLMMVGLENYKEAYEE